jgi:transcriptional regulator with XRE-family HTH domain
MRDTAMRLRHARKARDLTQQRLAHLSGVKQGSISDLERGESKTFRGNTLLSLARALNVSPEWLSHGRGSMERRDVPLSDEAVAVAQAWQRLVPELQKSTKDMILSMAEQSDKYGPAVDDHRVEEAYGRPGLKSKRP